VVLAVVVGLTAACGSDDGGGGELIDFVRLGTIEPRGVRAARLGTPESQAMAYSFANRDVPEGQAALEHEPSEGTAGFAFILSGCRNTGARLTVTETEINAEPTGGENWDCAAPEYFLATFEVPDDAVHEGAELANAGTASGGAPSSGEGELIELVQLGTIERGDVWAARLGISQAETMADRLAGLDAETQAEARAALDHEPPEGIAGFAFILAGCQETGARLIVTDGEIYAEVTGNEDVLCDAPEYFLATFEVPDDAVPEGAELVD
jgi:hypothetical protein